ncbi:MAG: EAL domain-containing protein [Alphaproteobacteria bacterium]|nr:EAL domain-containing protein [Alphaproteobacteria bacterium]
MSSLKPELDGLHAAIFASGDVAYDWDVMTGQIRWHGDVAALLRLTSKQDIGRAEQFLARVAANGIADLRRCHAEGAGHGQRFKCSYRVQRGDETLTWIEDRGWFERTENGEPFRITGILRCIDTNKAEALHAARQSGFDELTGQYNHGRLREALEHALTYSVRYNAPGVYLQVGIDNLPLINDTYGRDVAEQVVIAVSRELDRSLRASDVVGRIAQEQFGVILNGCPSADVSVIAEKILNAAQQASVMSDKGYLPVTASVGAVVFPESMQTAHEAMAKAALALEQARRSGNNCYNLYNLSADQLTTLRSNLAVTELVQTAIRQKRICLHFQPMVGTKDHKPSYYECLIRIYDDNGNVLPAGSFSPIAEKMGLVRSIDRGVLEMVLGELEGDPAVKLAMNISALSTTDPTWLWQLTAHVKTRPELARRLLVEITETTVLQDIKETIRFVAALKEMGVQVALDDFGAGYTCRNSTSIWSRSTASS